MNCRWRWIEDKPNWMQCARRLDRARSHRPRSRPHCRLSRLLHRHRHRHLHRRHLLHPLHLHLHQRRRHAVLSYVVFQECFLFFFCLFLVNSDVVVLFVLLISYRTVLNCMFVVVVVCCSRAARWLALSLPLLFCALCLAVWWCGECAQILDLPTFRSHKCILIKAKNVYLCINIGIMFMHR